LKNTIIETKFNKIGGDSPCYIIAEIGSNHNGDIAIAFELIEKAADANVNAVKFQTFKAKNHYSKKSPKISMYETDIYDLIESLEINREWHPLLAKKCAELGIDFLDSPCDYEAIELAISVDMPILKVASFDMVDLRLINKIAETNRAIMFSTGMANMAEIEAAIKVCRAANNNQIIALQCTSLYPAPANLSNLNAMKTLEYAFGVIVGYSDHTMGDHIPIAAVAKGAKVIEKHYTLNRSMTGPDHAFGIEPNELKQMVLKIRDVEFAMGDGIKSGPRLEESEMFNKVRRSIIAERDLLPGEIITSTDLVIKRPGLGINPIYLDFVIGRTVKIKIEKDAPIQWAQL
jgi:N,N'-diacetyllegionaminate synthase